MNYIILDLEWNQGGDGEEQQIHEMPFEIIEIGAVKCNEKKEIVDQFNRLICPTLYKKLHYVTKKMLGISMEELKKEEPFRKVIQEFLDWCGDDCFFCTWGPLDLLELQRNIRFHGLINEYNGKNTPFFKGPIAFYDIQKLFSLQYEDKTSRRNLEYAVDFLNIEKQRNFHRAYDDAYYTAKVFQKITDKNVEKHVSYDCFSLPQRKEEEIYVQFEEYDKYISKEYFEKAELMSDKDICSVKCRLCNKNLRKKIRWFSPNGKHYISIGTCSVHGYVRAKLRIKKSENGNLYAIKTTRFIDEFEKEEIKLRQEKAKKQKALKKKIDNQKNREKKKVSKVIKNKEV